MLPRQFITLGLTELSKDKFNPISNREMFQKPYGGLWASPYITDGEYVSNWHEWCENEMPHWISSDSVIFKLKEDSKVYIINSADDLYKLVNKVGSQKETCEFDRNKYIDFESATEQYDAIFLTSKGERNTRFSPNIKLYGWDVESILILNYDCIKTWEYKKLNIIK